MSKGNEQDLVQSLRHVAYKLGNWSRLILATEPEKVTGNVLLYEQAATEIEQLREQLAACRALLREAVQAIDGHLVDRTWETGWIERAKEVSDE